jgi:hypothetical protein
VLFAVEALGEAFEVDDAAPVPASADLALAVVRYGF